MYTRARARDFCRPIARSHTRDQHFDTWHILSARGSARYIQESLGGRIGTRGT